MQYISLQPTQITPALFQHFIRRQVVTQCYRRVHGEWTIQHAPFIDDWNKSDYAFLVRCLQGTLSGGGAVFGAIEDGELKGFASVEGRPMGRNGIYRDLTGLHVSADMRGRGIGRALFSRAAAWAKAHGAKKVYISSHSAVETQAFYAAMGCVDAAEPDEHHTQAEPYDRQLEYTI